MEKYIFAIMLCLCLHISQAQTLKVSGHVTDAENGEALIGASVFVESLRSGTTSNYYGFYSLALPQGPVKLTVTYLGYEKVEKELNLQQDITLNLKLKQVKNNLSEVVITAGANEDKEAVTSTQMSTLKITPAQIRHLPAIGGEVDVIKVMQLMPGVKRGGEGQTGMYVRGGGADQNLIQLDEATLYNVSHLFGFFSVFNNDAIKDVTLLKGSFPANYGGRISSVMDIRMKEGDSDTLHAEGGIGLLSSRLTLQGPIVKNKLSFLVSGRRSYIDKALGVAGLSVPYYFYDLNAKINYKISDKDRLYYSNYLGNDVLTEPKDLEEKQNGQEEPLKLDFGFKLGNVTNTIRWNHTYNNNLFSNLSLIHTRFRYDINGSFDDNKVFIGSKIEDFTLKLDYDYYHSLRHQLKFGVVATRHRFSPNVISAQGTISEALKSSKGTNIATQEAAVYLLDDYKLNDKLAINYGMRLSGMLTEGRVYLGPEPRLTATYTLSDNQSVKFGLSRAYQYLHMVSSSSLVLPTDLWYPVTKRVKPLYADQLAAGYSLYSDKLQTLLQVEGYYKRMHNLIEYREGAVLALNDQYEEELVSGMGEAYGMEVFVNKTKGRFTGWLGYSLSWSTRQFDELNNGNKFYSKYDRRHDISIVGSYQVSRRLAVSAVWVYATGQRLTGRTGQFAVPNPALSGIDFIPVYTDKHALRFSPSHRLDFNLILKNKPQKRFQSEWHVGAYNVYNRAQPYRVRVVQNGSGYKFQQVGLFGFIPSISYNFKF
ncbi:MAG: TonB-dependent receptor [Hymenobacteraceae bacterium]|nr:TonB-dependent receptor [Hymenobacteraceae bacterium]MDX5396391.1 TonB-dependent receptor [Hymenobacteraceae bacterium]MDX5443361.1 TonB-dependent receptor [Hymenobacteraceae bacterium]MDX5512453.1 TonB-dependent receptor [Hymenobacteraceae bacterium]